MLDINKLIQAEHLAACEAEEFLHGMEPWSEDRARALAAEEHLNLNDEHMEVICWLRDHYADCGPAPNARQLLKAMEESFAAEGGRKYLYGLFPQGPVNQGTRLAGLPVPAGCNDPSFGSTH